MTEVSTQWAVVELFGHLAHTGILSEVTRFGETFAQVKALQPSGAFIEILIGGKAIFRATAITEEEARKAVMPRAWSACSSFTQPSAVEGLCAKCGRDEEAHKPVPALPPPRSRADRIVEHHEGTGETSRILDGDWWAVFGDDGMPHTFYLSVHRVPANEEPIHVLLKGAWYEETDDTSHADEEEDLPL